MKTILINRNRQLKIGAFLSYFSIVFNIIAGLIYTPWMIHQIGQSDYALYTLSNSIITLFLIDFGLGTATTRFVAKYTAEGNTEKIQVFLSAVYKLYLLLDVIIFVLLVVVYCSLEFLYSSFSLIEIEKLKIIFCITGFYSLLSFPCVTFNGILTAYEKFIPLKLADLIQKIISICFTVVALCLGYGLYSLVAVNAFSGVVAIIIKFIYVKKDVKIHFVKSGKEVFKEIFNFSIWSTIWAMSQRLIFNITPSLLGIIAKNASSAIAVFGIVTTLESYVYIITNAINGMFLSQITRIVQKDSEGKKLTDLAIKIGRYQFAINTLIILGFIFVGKEFIFLWIGEEYSLAYYCILLVILPGLFYNSLQIANSAMVAQNLIKYQAYIHLVMGVCNLCLSFFLSSKWGVVGASLSICIAYIIRWVFTLLLVRAKLNIDLYQFVQKCYIRMALPLLIAFIICGCFLNNIHALSWGMFFIKGFIVVAVYFIALFLVGFSRDERKKILSGIRLSR